MKKNCIHFKFYRFITLFAILLLSIVSINSSCKFWEDDDDSSSDFPYCASGYASAASSDNISCSAIVQDSEGGKTCADNSSDQYYDDAANYQWHLLNTTNGDYDINVEPVWTNGSTNRGDEVVIAVVDDGMEYFHEDLECNVLDDYNHNYLTGGTNINSGIHGTAVAGVAAARDKNGMGVRGAAPRADLVGYNLLQNMTTSNQFDAMKRDICLVSVSNNSWGPTDNTGRLYTSTSLWRMGIYDGIKNGRDGKGIVYTWAAGNGGSSAIDNSNYDGYANFYGVIAVGGLNPSGTKAAYSENGANVWISTYTAGLNTFSSQQGITTTDRAGSGISSGAYPNLPGAPDLYTSDFDGTSSSAPLAAGVIALILKANPDLTWRDVKLILADPDVAVKVDPSDSDWTTNGAGYNINHKYGFGSIDAEAAVNKAASWSNVGAFKVYYSGSTGVNLDIPDNDSSGVSTSMEIPGDCLSKIEYVEINININHGYSGDLEISLTSPDGTESILSEQRTCPASCSYFGGGASFRFGSVRHLGENPGGNWTLTVKDRDATIAGSLNNWSLKFYGEE